MRIFAFAIVCFMLGFLFVQAAVQNPIAAIVAVVVNVAAAPSTLRFAKFVSDVVEARKEKKQAVRSFIETAVTMYGRCTCKRPSIGLTVENVPVCMFCRKNAKVECAS